MPVKKSHEEFVEELHKTLPHIEVLEQYKTARKNIKFRCTTHDYEFYAAPTNMLKNSRRGCMYCGMDYVASTCRKTNDEFLEELKIKAPNVIPLENYNLYDKKIKVQCKVCGNIWISEPRYLLKGIQCKKCSTRALHKLMTKTHERFIEDFKNRNPNKDTIEIVGRYKHDEAPIECCCKRCGYTWYPRARYLIRNKRASGCPHCNMSKGELAVESFLSKNSIIFEEQKSFDDLVGTGGRLLSYDFYLPKNNLLIEYQGVFHDGSVPYQTREQFIYRQTHDDMKRQYAKNHGIELLEIWYKDFDNIEQILTERLCAS